MNIFGRLAVSMIPLAIQQLKGVPLGEKQNFAAFICLVSQAYARGERAEFDNLVGKLNLGVEALKYKDLVIGALWNEDQSK